MKEHKLARMGIKLENIKDIFDSQKKSILSKLR